MSLKVVPDEDPGHRDRAVVFVSAELQAVATVLGTFEGASIDESADTGAYAVELAHHGWPVFPLRGKVPAIPGGRGVLDATTDLHQVAAWWSGRYTGANIGARVPEPLIVVDVDPRHAGHEALAALEAEHGPLPPTLTVRSGRGNGGSHRYFRRPAGKLTSSRLRGTGIDLKTATGYVVVPPSVHPDSGEPYTWTDLRDPVAPPRWLVDLLRPVVPAQRRPAPSWGPMRGGTSVADDYTANTSWIDVLGPHGWVCLDAAPDADGARWRHPAATSAVSATVKYGCLFCYTTSTVLPVTEADDPHGLTRFRAHAILDHGGRPVGRGPCATCAGGRMSIPNVSRLEPMPDDGDGALDHADEVVAAQAADLFTRGGSFILDAPDQPPALWGSGPEVLWAAGESLVLCGPQGVGKTTVAQQLMRARVGLASSVLGWPVQPAERRVLYLAMDRPAQPARSMRRCFTESERAQLDDRLVIWQGPPPHDLAKHPHMLREMARRAGADTVFLDSMKDAAIGLTEDEVGAAYNRARQLALVDGVQLVEQHHQTKRGPNGGKPNTLADVYGSVWLTAAAEEVGPLRLIHDHGAGSTEVWHGVDLLAVARACRGGLTSKAAAGALFSTDKPSPAEVEKARRKLDRLTDSGHLQRREASSGGAGGKLRRDLPRRCLPGLRGGLVSWSSGVAEHPPARVGESTHGALTGTHVRVLA